MCSSFRPGRDNPFQKAGLLVSNTKLCCVVERSVRDFQSGRKSGNAMLIFKYRLDLDFPSVRRFCLELCKNSISCWSKVMHSLILKVKESRKSNFLYNFNLSGHKNFLSIFFSYCTRRKINTWNMTSPNINAVMEGHDISVWPKENNLHLPGKYLNSFY